MVAMVRKKLEHAAQDCPLYSEFSSLKDYAAENRQMIQNNHAEVMELIGNMKNNNSIELENIAVKIGETNSKFDKMIKTIERTGRVFAWWDSLPEKIRKVTKILSMIVAVMGGATVVMTFFEKVLGS